MTIQEILLSAFSTIFLALVTWGTTMLIKWLNSKIKDKELRNFAITISTAVSNSVKSTYQTYVQAVKGTDLWDREAQKTALTLALETAKHELNGNVLDYIKENYNDIDGYLTNLIESYLYDLKN